MAKFAQADPPVTGPVQTTTTPTVTFEGAPAYTRDAKSDLFLLAVTNMVGEDTFYEKAGERDTRFASLIHQVTVEDPDWLRRFIPWLRHTANMRSAPIVALAEYVKAGGKNGRALINSTLARPDEPAELLAYWHLTYGRKLPAAIKRGVADSTLRLFTESAALKYDGTGNKWRLGDVIELVHPKPKAPWQSDLFRYLLNERHGRITETVPESLPMIAGRAALPENVEELLADPDRLKAAGVTWEWLSSKTKMDARAWEAVIPSMGYMALLRNLRNFTEANIGLTATAYVQKKLADPEEVAKSKQFPFRFFSAYLNATDMTWAATLETALNHATDNVPEFSGRTLILTDTSGSMQQQVSNKSKVCHYQIAAVFAASLARKAEKVELVSFADRWEKIPVNRSVLRMVETVYSRNGFVGHGTNLGQAIAETWSGHDRVVVFSDMQTADRIPNLPVPLFVFNTGGYGRSPIKVGSDGRYEIGGFTDSTFALMKILEARRSAVWPF